ncbi:uncharacterized protein B0P05DRAFT_466397, partial [Gilbertella persicaria]|uniref:uncharacterized protein n=1 Tax=Gilbertella persicaria TaxID=101096 RepID=UPI00221F66BF
IVDDEETVKKVLEHGQHKEWARCPRCEHLVEKVSGCITMRCVCGAYFCYRCGGLSQDHSCINRCQNFTPQELSKARNSMFDHTTKRIKTKNLA